MQSLGVLVSRMLKQIRGYEKTFYLTFFIRSMLDFVGITYSSFCLLASSISLTNVNLVFF